MISLQRYPQAANEVVRLTRAEDYFSLSMRNAPLSLPQGGQAWMAKMLPPLAPDQPTRQLNLRESLLPPKADQVNETATSYPLPFFVLRLIFPCGIFSALPPRTM